MYTAYLLKRGLFNIFKLRMLLILQDNFPFASPSSIINTWNGYELFQGVYGHKIDFGSSAVLPRIHFDSLPFRSFGHDTTNGHPCRTLGHNTAIENLCPIT